MKLNKKEYRCFAMILVLMQVLDGVLTWWGVSNFGSSIEGNPLVKLLIDAFGAAPALIGIKLIGIALSFAFIKLRAAKSLIFLAGLYTGVVLIWIRCWIFY